MLKNYLKIAFRNLLKQKLYSIVNITGLAIGMSVCILILLYVREEMSYDRYHEYSERIYRIQRHFLQADGSVRWQLASIAPSFVPLLENDFPEMEHVVRMTGWQERMVVYDEKRFVEQRLFFAEADIFEVFTIPLLKGDPQSALKEPGSMVISETTARKYFG